LLGPEQLLMLLLTLMAKTMVSASIFLLKWVIILSLYWFLGLKSEFFQRGGAMGNHKIGSSGFHTPSRS